jgi:hypothetical protein
MIIPGRVIITIMMTDNYKKRRGSKGFIALVPPRQICTCIGTDSFPVGRIPVPDPLLAKLQGHRERERERERETNGERREEKGERGG